MARSNSATLRNAPRRMLRSVIRAKNRSTWFSQDELVGVKCATNSGWRTNHSRSRKVAERFAPSAIYWFVNSLFREHNACHEAHINSHDYRRRAISKAFDAGFTREEVARMFGLTAQTAERYCDAWQHRSTDKQFAALAPALLPTPAPMVQSDV